MLCRSCHVHVRRDFPYCLRCGTLRRGASVAEFEAPSLVFRVVASGMREQRVQLDGASVTLGREPDNDVVLDDSSVSRHHATIRRTAAGWVVEDHDSFNGTTVTPLAGAELPVSGAPVALADHATVHVGDVAVLFDQPRSAAVGGRTQVKDIAGTVLGKTADGDDEPPPASEPLDALPRRRSGWALKQVEPDRWVLRNTRTHAYLSLDERDVFLWNRLDGRHAMRDLLFAYLEEYGELALPRIESTVRSLHEAGLVRGLPGDVEDLTFWRRFGRALVKNLIRVEVSVRGLDPLVEKLYHRVAWRLFTLPAVLALWVLTLGGLAAFVVAAGEKQLFDFGGTGVVGLVAAGAGYVVATTLHELAHALAVKSYGRRVNRGGFLLMMGMPFAFVDTSDMWFGTSWSRIVVAVSGPLTTVGVAGAASVAAVTVPSPVAAGICFTLAAGLYTNTLFNLVPLIPLDGYQALADALRMPRLKEEAKAYFSGGLLRDLRAGRRPGPRQVGLLVFGLLSVVCLWGMLAMSVLTWDSRLGNLAREYIPQPWLGVVVVAALLVILFPAWYSRVRVLARRVWGRRAPSRPAPGHEEVLPSPEVAVAGPIDPERAVEVVAGVAAVVEKAHWAGRAHGGVRLSAVRVAPGGVVELADPPAAGAPPALDDLDYAAPEVFDGEVGRAADVYALGGLLHELLTGERPFPVSGAPALMRAHLSEQPPAPSRSRPEVPAELDIVVARAMDKDPARRFDGVGDLVEAARTALAAPRRETTTRRHEPVAEAAPVPTTDSGARPAASRSTEATFLPARATSTDATYLPRRVGPSATDATYLPGR